MRTAHSQTPSAEGRCHRDIRTRLDMNENKPSTHLSKKQWLGRKMGEMFLQSKEREEEQISLEDRRIKEING